MLRAGSGDHGRGDVDDPPELPRDHAGHDVVDQHDRGEVVALIGLHPVLAGRVEEHLRLRPGVIVQQDVRGGAGFDQRVAAVLGGDVAGDGGHLAFRLPRKRLGGAGQPVGVAPVYGDVHPFRRQRPRAGVTEPVA